MIRKALQRASQAAASAAAASAGAASAAAAAAPPDPPAPPAAAPSRRPTAAWAAPLKEPTRRSRARESALRARPARHAFTAAVWREWGVWKKGASVKGGAVCGHGAKMPLPPTPPRMPLRSRAVRIGESTRDANNSVCTAANGLVRLTSIIATLRVDVTVLS